VLSRIGQATSTADGRHGAMVVSRMIRRRAISVPAVNLAICLCAVCLNAADQQPIRVQICELFHNLRSYDGKLVEIEGAYLADRHGAGLGARCCNRVFLDGHEWMSAFCPVSASAPPPFKRSEVTFTTDDESLKRLWAFYDKVKARDPVSEVFGTFVGEVQLKDSYARPLIMPEAGYAYGPGFCHLGSYPALLVIKEVKAFREIRRVPHQPACPVEPQKFKPYLPFFR